MSDTPIPIDAYLPVDAYDSSTHALDCQCDNVCKMEKLEFAFRQVLQDMEDNNVVVDPAFVPG